MRTIIYENVEIVGDVNFENNIKLPENIELWSPPNGSVVTLSKKTYSVKEILNEKLITLRYINQTNTIVLNSKINNLILQEIEIYDLNGQLNFCKKNINSKLVHYNLIIPSLSFANYLIRLKTNKGILIKTIIIQ